MKLMDLVKENERLIIVFEEKCKSGDYAIISAINALDNNNELQEYFVQTIDDDFSVGELIARLYAILQGLFVSIDSLYSLAYAITKSKSFININQNPELRQLKYIRNDVVGHPANRVYDNMSVGYCVLPKEKISKKHFSYFIHAQGNTTTKEIDLVSILENYYNEANNLLKTIYDVSQKQLNDNIISRLTINIYEMFLNGKNIDKQVSRLKSQYQEIYTNPDNKQHRLLWRISLLERLIKINSSNPYEKEIYDYSTLFEIIKINELAKKIEKETVISLSNKMRTPKYLASFFRMLNRNTNKVYLIDNIHDMTHPLFDSSLNELLKLALKTPDAYKYLKMLKYYTDLKDSDMVYALGVLAKNYKKRKN